MTREEVIKALSICTYDEPISCDGSGCPYKEKRPGMSCTKALMKDVLVFIESDRDKAMGSRSEKVVEYKILNREDLLNAFHEYVYAQADFYMNYTDRADSPETAQTFMSEICGAAVLMNNIMNPRNEMLNSKPPEA